MNSSAACLQKTTTEFANQLLSTAAGNLSNSDVELSIYSIGFNIYFYSLSLFIIPVGIACNLFTMYVFVTTPTFYSSSTTHFLIALSLTDCLVLVGDALRCLSMRNPYYVYPTGLTFFDTSNFACKFVNYWRYRYLMLRLLILLNCIASYQNVTCGMACGQRLTAVLNH